MQSFPISVTCNEKFTFLNHVKNNHWNVHSFFTFIIMRKPAGGNFSQVCCAFIQTVTFNCYSQGFHFNYTDLYILIISGSKLNIKVIGSWSNKKNNIFYLIFTLVCVYSTHAYLKDQEHPSVMYHLQHSITMHCITAVRVKVT